MRSHKVRLVVGVVFGGGLLAWFLLTLEWRPFVEQLRSVDLLFVGLAAAILFCEFLLRALRWRVLMRPLTTTLPYRSLLSATLVGAAVNTLLPARAGDVARPLVAHGRTGVPLAQVVTTTVVERVFDLVGLLSVFLFMMLTLPTYQGPEGELVENLRRYGVIMGGAGLAGLLFLVFLARRRGSIRGHLERLVERAPGRLAAPLGRVLSGLVEGLSGLSRGREVALALVLSVVIWANGVLAIWILFKAFHLTLPLASAAFTAVAIALTVALPQAPGFVGVFHVAIEKTLVLWGAGGGQPEAFAVVFWGVSFLPVTMAGLVALWVEGLGFGGLLGKEARERQGSGGGAGAPRTGSRGDHGG